VRAVVVDSVLLARASVPGYPYDIEKAMRLLAEAGHKGGMSLLVNKPRGNAYRTQELVDVVGEMYSKVDVTVEVDSYDGLEPGGYSDKVRSKDIGDMCWFDSSPLSTFRVMREKLHSGLRGPWWEGYANPEVDRLIEEAADTVNQRDRRAIYERIYRMTSLDPPLGLPIQTSILLGRGPKSQGMGGGGRRIDTPSDHVGARNTRLRNEASFLYSHMSYRSVQWVRELSGYSHDEVVELLAQNF
jgi:ABC-type transport system substrate-binding protein